MDISVEDVVTEIISSDSLFNNCTSCQLPAFEEFQDILIEHEHLLQSVESPSIDFFNLPESPESTENMPTLMSNEEPERIRVLRELHILDSADEECYDRYVSLIKRYFRLPIAFLSFVDVRRTWFKSSIGLTAGWKEASRSVSFCSYAVLDESPEVFLVPDTLQDPRFVAHPFVIQSPFVRFYIGACVRVQGMKVGSLCLMDMKPHCDWTEADQQVLLDIAKVIGNMLEERRRMLLHIESEKAKILLSVFYMLKRPILALNQSYSSLEALYSSWKFGGQLPGASHSAEGLLHAEKYCEGTSFPVWKEKIDTWSMQCQSFASRLELTLRVVHRLLLGNQATAAMGSSPKPKLCPCSVYELIQHMKSYIPIFNQHIERQVLFSKFTLVFPHVEQVSSLSEIYSHPDVIVLLSLTLLAYLHQHDYSTVSVNFDFRAETDSSSSLQFFPRMQALAMVDFSNRAYCATPRDIAASHNGISSSPQRRTQKRNFDISTAHTANNTNPSTTNSTTNNSTRSSNGVASGEEDAEGAVEGWYRAGFLHISFTTSHTMSNPTEDIFDDMQSSSSYEILALKHAIHFVGGQFHGKQDPAVLGEEAVRCYELCIPTMMKATLSASASSTS